MIGRGRAGFTLIEALIVLALMTVIVVKIAMVIQSATEASSRESTAMALEDQARHVLDKIAYSLMGADRDELFPDPESPDYSTEVSYRVSLGLQDGEVVWTDPESLGLSEDERQVVWRQNPETSEERKVAWSNFVRSLLEGELPNGIDDNGNGLVDEKGLTFSLDRNGVTIRLCLERRNKDGTAYTEAVETMVTVRN